MLLSSTRPTNSSEQATWGKSYDQRESKRPYNIEVEMSSFVRESIKLSENAKDDSNMSTDNE